MAHCITEEQVSTLATDLEMHHYCAQSHVHVYTTVADAVLSHSHLILGITGDAIPAADGSHYHQLTGRTDWKETHYHGYCVNTSPAVRVDDTMHIHSFEGLTLVAAGHQHAFRSTTVAAEQLK